MWKLLLLLIGAEIVSAFAEESVCDWSRKHDGHGDSEDEEGTFPTDTECVQHCEEKKKTKPEVNGATVRTSDNMCWCEIGMNKKEESDKYDTCYLKVKDVGITHCPQFTTGDGEPGDELYFPDVKGSDCATHCSKEKEQNPHISASTIKNGDLSQQGCWCQVGATYNDGDSRYQTCFLKAVCGEWQVTECTVTCGGGHKTRTRDCEKGGLLSKYREQEVHECNAVDCPEVCGEWKVTPCTVTCGGGKGGRTRECEKGGVSRTEGVRHECNAHECPHTCELTLGGNSGGSCCTFPFTYQGQTHYKCTDKGWHTFWCATTDNYDTDGKWGECDFDDSCLATEGGNADPGQACHFPFIYRGEQVNSCIKTRHNRLWCATTDNYDIDWKWGNCLPKRTMCSFPLFPPFPHQ